MDPTCKLCSKCLKADERLEKCEVTECNNITPKLWQEINGNRMSGRVHCFVASAASSNTKSLLQVPQVKPKEGFHGMMMA